MQNEKRKFREAAKIAAASLALVSVFSFALMGANKFAFANASNRTIDVPLFEAMSVSQNMHSASPTSNMGVSIANALSTEQSPRRNLTVNETAFESWLFGSSHAKNENTLSAEEAAQIGAQYIYEIFGECIDGATVQITFNGHLRHRGTFGVWTGTVGDGITPDGIDFDMPIGTPMFLFMINAETGEAIHVERMTSFTDGFVVLNPRSYARIEFDIPHITSHRPYHIYRFEDWDTEQDHRRELFFFPVELDELGCQWLLPDGAIRIEGYSEWIFRIEIDDFDEWLQQFEGSGNPSIIRRFTPTIPVNPQQPQENENGDARQT